MNKLVPTEDPGLARDTSNHALLNTNAEAWRLYRQNRQAQQNISTVEQRVEVLETELKYVRSSLDTIIELLQNKK